MKQKIRKKHLTHAQRNQQKKREEVIAKFRELSTSEQKVALDFVEHSNQFFNEDLRPDRSTFAKPIINGLFHDAKYSTVTDIAKVTGKSETTVRDALKGKFKFYLVPSTDGSFSFLIYKAFQFFTFQLCFNCEY
jgi:hypothetical protein